MSIYNRIRRFMSSVTLSRGLELVNNLKSRGSYKPHWYKLPVTTLIEQVGDIPVRDVTPEMVHDWYDAIRAKPNERTGKPMSPYTVNSYARALRAYFGHLVNMGHIDESPALNLRLPKLPTTSKNAISDSDLERVISAAKLRLRDYAIILILRDSGVRVGELVAMTLENIRFETYTFEQISDERIDQTYGFSPRRRIRVLEDNDVITPGMDVRLRGRAMVLDEKTGKYRMISFQHEAAVALRHYLDARPATSHDALWVNERNDEPLKASGVQEMLKKLKRKTGVKRCNAHSFRHRLAKKLKERRVDPEIISRILGHSDVRTYQTVYGTTRDTELIDYHTMYVDF